MPAVLAFAAIGDNLHHHKLRIIPLEALVSPRTTCYEQVSLKVLVSGHVYYCQLLLLLSSNILLGANTTDFSKYGSTHWVINKFVSPMLPYSITWNPHTFQ